MRKEGIEAVWGKKGCRGGGGEVKEEGRRQKERSCVCEGF